MPQKAIYFVNKLLKMAKAAAMDKAFNPSDMVISQIYVGNGSKIKRFRPQARGRMNAYVKHLAHLTIEVEPIKIPEIKETKPSAKKEADIIETKTVKTDEKETNGTKS